MQSTDNQAHNNQEKIHTKCKNWI